MFDSSSSNLYVLVASAIAPGVFFLWFFLHQDRYKHESIKLLSVTFLLGALSTIPAILLELVLGTVLPIGFDLTSIFLYFLVGVALVEESMKFLAIRIYAYRSPHFDEPMDGIVLGVAAALGFATVENIGYVLQFGPIAAILRAFVSIPSHALNGAIIGYYLGEAKFHNDPSLAVRGLAIAIVLHALFDTAASILPDAIAVAGLVLFVIVVYFGIVRKEMKKAEEESPHRSSPSGFDDVHHDFFGDRFALGKLGNV